MSNNQSGELSFELMKGSSTLSHITVSIPTTLVDAIYNEASLAQKRNLSTQGFNKGEVPLCYITRNLNKILIEHVTEFLFNYFVISFVYREIRNKKLLVAGKPRLTSTHVQIGENALFNFDITLFPGLPVQDWKHLPFKTPLRKNYKDLDRQVKTFMKEEIKKQEDHEQQSVKIQIGDWINFDVFLSNDSKCPLLTHQEHLWLKIGDEEADTIFQELFLNRAAGDVVCTKNDGLQRYFSTRIETDYFFCVKINNIVSASYFSVDQFKSSFRLKTNKATHQKIIEVFSYRNDLSQRRTIAEETLQLLLTKNKFNVPNHLILRQQKEILDKIRSKPDYLVYRGQSNFERNLQKLAEKQAKELLLLDHMASRENISVENADIQNYLNLSLRPRTKEFIYFDLPNTKIEGQEAPIPEEELKASCLREKTLNYIIYQLTRY